MYPGQISLYGPHLLLFLELLQGLGLDGRAGSLLLEVLLVDGRVVNPEEKSGDIATTQQTAKPTMVWAEQPSVPPPSLKNLIQRKQCPEEELGISQPRSGDRKRQIIVFATVASSGPQLHTCSTTEVPLEPTLKICLDSHFKTIF